MSYIEKINTLYITLSFLLLFAGIISYKISKRYYPIFGVCVFWFLFSCIRVFAMPVSPYASEGIAWTYVMDIHALSTLVYAALIAVPIFVLPFNFLRRTFIVLSVVNAFCIIIGVIIALLINGKPDVFGCGILLNQSMSACFSLCVLPLVLPRFYPSVVIVLASLITGASVPIGILGAMGLAYLIRHKRWAYIVVLCGVLVVIPYLFLGNKLFDSSGRFHAWELADQWLLFAFSHTRAINSIWGSGGGSFFGILPDATSRVVTGNYIWLHNDWFTIAGEYGLIGYVIAAMLYAKVLTRTTYFYAVIGFFVFMFFNMPFHYIISASYGIFLIRSAFRTCAFSKHTKIPNCS